MSHVPLNYDPARHDPARHPDAAAPRRPVVAIYLPDLSGGGAEKLQVNSATAYQQAGFDVVFVLHRCTGPLVSQVPPGVRIVDLQASRTLAALRGLYRYLRTEQPDILLSNLGHSNIISIWLRRLLFRQRTRVVVVHHNALKKEAVHVGRWQNRLLPLLVRLFLAGADGIVAVSRGVAIELAEVMRLPPQRVTVIYNAIVDETFAARSQEPCPHPWLADGQPPVILAAGRLVGQKDPLTLLEAFARLQDTSLRLVWLGEGPLRPRVEERIRALGLQDRVDLPGFCANPLPYMRRAALLVLPSRYEGFGNVLVEAMACGTPVVSTACPFGPDEILEDGRFGPLVPVGDISALAEAISTTLAAPLPAIELQQRAAEFSVSRAVGQYVALFRRLMPPS